MVSSKAISALGSYLMLAVVASPVLRNWQVKPRDDFPLSHYPMFSAKRHRHSNVVHLVAAGADGVERNVPYSLVGTGGFNQVRRQIAKRARTSTGAEELAREALQTLISQGQDPQVVRVVKSTFNYDAFFAGRREPVKVRELASVTREER